MRRTITLALALACLVLAASSLTAAGGRDAMSPVGAWAVYFEPDPDSEGDPNTSMSLFDRGGTVTGGAWTDPLTNTAGSWEKLAGNRYRSTFYVMIPEFDGILKVREEFWMLNKDEMEGRGEAWWVPGQDPLGDAVVPLWWGSSLYKRIKAEPKQLP